MGKIQNAIYTLFKGDLEDTNEICKVRLNGIDLPLDVVISIDGNKIIAQSQILDGVAVFERVTRKPMDIDFDFTVRQNKKTKPEGIIPGLTFNKPTVNNWIFPLDDVNTIFGYHFVPDQVLAVENIFLNKLGIMQLIVADIHIGTARGSVDVPMRLKCLEDFYSTKTQGTTLII